MARRVPRRPGDKERFWRGLLRQWRGSGMSVRDFCAEQEVSEPSFYAWRRTLAERDQQAAGKARPAERRTGDNDGTAQRPVFVPLRVVATAADHPGLIEVVLKDGRVLRVPANFDPATLRQLLTILEEDRPC